MSDWNDERVAELRRRWKDGESAGDIARAMNVTRNAALGKLMRLGLLGTRTTPSRPVKAVRFGTENNIDRRDLTILDALVNGASVRAVARQFSVAPAYVEALWAAREACA